MTRVPFKALILVLTVFVSLVAMAGEGRTPLYAWSNTITAPGKYIVTRNIIPLICTSPTITIQASNVDIDLNGFMLQVCPGHPVITGSGQNNITVRNGTLQSSDFGVEIIDGYKVVIEDVKILDMQFNGIRLEKVTDFAIRRVNVFGAVQEGILIDGVDPAEPVQGTIEDNQVENAGGGITVRAGSSVAILNNRLEDLIIQPGLPGAIVYAASEGGLISENTIQEILDGSGVVLEGSSGCKIYNNVVRRAEQHGIWLAGRSNDNLVLNNVATQSGFDGLRVEGSRCQIDRNVLNSNCQSGAQCWGLHFSAVVGGNDSTYGRNTARGNIGTAAACPTAPAPANPPTTDFCDEQLPSPGPGPGNTSFNDNFMPTLF